MTVEVPPADGLLVVEDLAVRFADRPILHQISFGVAERQIAAVVGPNGAGKSTILKTICGLMAPVEGRILLAGEDITGRDVADVVAAGLVYVPEGMAVFAEMSVLENLEVGAYLRRREIAAKLEQVFCLFPELRDKRSTPAGALSGGEQRMVTLGRGLMAGARLLLLDDPFLGLSPKIVRRFCNTFRKLRRSGMTLIIAGQHVRRILNVADWAFLIEDGTITLSGPGPEILCNFHLQQILFGRHVLSSQPAIGDHNGADGAV